MNATDLTEEQRRQLDRHLDELDRWNRRLNLTTVPREAAWNRHVVESLALLEAARLATGASCADLGSGGGVPGIPIAVLRPDLAVTLIDSDRRKAGFLVHVCGMLGLDAVQVVDRRAEEMAADAAHRGRYDVVVSRAAAPPARLWALAAPLLTPAGSLWALVAPADGAAAELALTAALSVRVERPAPGILRVRRPGG